MHPARQRFAWIAAVAAFASARLAVAAAPDAPPPAALPAGGTIDDSAAALGRHVFHVVAPPATGRLAVPQGFPQIVRATATIDGAPRDVAVEIAADAKDIEVLLPASADGATPARVAIDTADATMQFDDGRIVLAARDARVEGGRAKLETQPGNHRIGFWTDVADAVTWTRKLTRWGAYDAILTYSAAGPDGTEIEVAFGDVKLAARLRSTGSWYRYATLPLGRVHLPTAGDLAVRVACTKKAGAAVMNLKAITLEPACEGTPPVQGDDGVVVLHGRDATVRGTVLRYEPAEKKQTLGFWVRPSDAATWSFTVRKPGEFTIEVLQGCGRGQGGSEMAVEVDRGRPDAPDAVLFTVEDTGHFQAFVPRNIGRVKLGAGTHELRVAPRRIAKGAACDIRQIRLVPVAAP